MKVAILLWDDVELLTFAGPARVFTEVGGGGAFFVYTVAESRYPIVSEGFLEITPEFSLDDAPCPDVVIVPGGGVSYVMRRGALLRWVREAASAARAVLAVSSGASVLEAIGVPRSAHGCGETVLAPDPAAATRAARRIVGRLYGSLWRADSADETATP